jgi:hypothetical protein
VPARVGIDPGAQAHGAGHGIARKGRAPVGPDHHHLALAEVGAIGDRLGHARALPGKIEEAAQLLCHPGKVRGDGLGVEAGGAQNARALAGLHLGAEQQVDARHGQVS